MDRELNDFGSPPAPTAAQIGKRRLRVGGAVYTLGAFRESAAALARTLVAFRRRRKRAVANLATGRHRQIADKRGAENFECSSARRRLSPQRQRQLVVECSSRDDDAQRRLAAGERRRHERRSAQKFVSFVGDGRFACHF